MKIMTYKKIFRIFHLRIHGKTRRIRKKNNKRISKYLKKYGCVTKEIIERGDNNANIPFRL